jgi:hypothetical protein
VSWLTQRPGRIAANVPIPFPRPRDLNLLHQEAFGEIVGRLRATIEAHEGVAAN